MSIAVYIILWWLAFFVMLPIGAQSSHEAGEKVVPGAEAGAPRAHRLLLKGAIALGIAAVLWLGVYWAVTHDVFNVRAE